VDFISSNISIFNEEIVNILRTSFHYGPTDSNEICKTSCKVAFSTQYSDHPSRSFDHLSSLSALTTICQNQSLPLKRESIDFSFMDVEQHYMASLWISSDLFSPIASLCPLPHPVSLDQNSSCGSASPSRRRPCSLASRFCRRALCKGHATICCPFTMGWYPFLHGVKGKVRPSPKSIAA
jgi:hypothetical protein